MVARPPKNVDETNAMDLKLAESSLRSGTGTAGFEYYEPPKAAVQQLKTPTCHLTSWNESAMFDCTVNNNVLN